MTVVSTSSANAGGNPKGVNSLRWVTIKSLDLTRMLVTTQKALAGTLAVVTIPWVNLPICYVECLELNFCYCGVFLAIH